MTPKEIILAAFAKTGAMIQADALAEFERAVDRALAQQRRLFKDGQVREYLTRERPDDGPIEAKD